MFYEPIKDGLSAEPGVVAAIHDNISLKRGFEGCLNTGNAYGLSLVRSRIDAFRITLSADLKGARDEDLEE